MKTKTMTFPIKWVTSRALIIGEHSQARMACNQGARKANVTTVGLFAKAVIFIANFICEGPVHSVCSIRYIMLVGISFLLGRLD